MVPFSDFYRALHGRSPLPWQNRLAERVVADRWPTEIGVPTGLGKTSCIDIAVWSLAAQADLPPAKRTVPTRIWYVVNRRLLVDAASGHAAKMEALLADPGSSPHGDTAVLREVAARLQTISATGTSSDPLFVSRLRGGAQPGQRPFDPSQPAIICATVPMFASRLLFRGYGTSSRLWPIDAAHAGIDALVLLDEAHLSEPLRALVEVVPDCDAHRAGILRMPGRAPQSPGPAALLPAPRRMPVLVSMTATGSATSDQRFDLDDADFQADGDTNVEPGGAPCGSGRCHGRADGAGTSRGKWRRVRQQPQDRASDCRRVGDAVPPSRLSARDHRSDRSAPRR
jgi:CRISPR-associated endonuclease/helicase Cas3